MLDGYKTYIGILITILAALDGIFKWGLGDLAVVGDQVIALVGSALAIYGRAVAKPKGQ